MTDFSLYDIPCAPCNTSKRLNFLFECYDGARDECITWPFWKNRKGYGRIQVKLRHVRVHRLVCFWRHGPPPSPNHHAAHECGNAACCNPNHISWKTPTENEHDKARHGTRVFSSHSPL